MAAGAAALATAAPPPSTAPIPAPPRAARLSRFRPPLGALAALAAAFTAAAAAWRAPASAPSSAAAPPAAASASARASSAAPSPTPDTSTAPAPTHGASVAPISVGGGGEEACRRGREEARAGRRLAAIASFRRGLGASPDLVDCRAALATLLLREHRWREAEAEYRRALEAHSRSAASTAASLLWVGLGEALELQGDLARASACYQQALALEPASPRALGHLATVRRRAGDLEGAVAAWKEYLGQRPEDAAALERLEEVLRLQAELRLLEEAASRSGAGSAEWEALARVRRAAADVRGALEARSRAAAAAPRDAGAALRLGLAALEEGDRREARRAFERALRLDPGLVAAYAHLARLDEQEGDAAAEARWWERLLERNPLDRVALARRVELAQRAGDLALLEKQAARASAGKDDAAAPLRLALLRAARGDERGAEEAFALALERAPAEPVVQDSLREFLRGGGQLVERRKARREERAQGRAPDRGPAAPEVGRGPAPSRADRGPAPSPLGRGLLEAHRLLAAGDAAAAAAGLAALVEAAPGRADLRSALAEMLAAAGRGSEAGREQERALEIDPHLRPARLWLALRALSAGDAAEAERLARRAVELEPRHPHALAVLGFARYRQGDLAGAAEAARAALESDPWEQAGGLRFLLARCFAGLGDLRAAEEAATGDLPRAGWLMYELAWAFARELFLEDRPPALWEAWRRRPGELPGGPEEALPRISEFLGALDERYTRLRTPEETLQSHFARLPDSPEMTAGSTAEANHSVIGRRLSENLAYIRLADFRSPRLAEVVRQVLEGLKDAPALVLDLRGNPGGLKDEARAVAELLLPPGTPLLREEQREGGSTTRAGPGAGADTERPLVVLVDERTGSAAEILAGALQSAGRAILVGETTRGKGVSQAVRLLPGAYSVAVTAARSFDPSGRPLDEGVRPQTAPSPAGSGDPALDKAREILQEP